MSDLAIILKQVESIESQMTAFHTKAAEELKITGSMNTETIKALDSLGEQQLELAARMLLVEQAGGGVPGGGDAVKSMGAQFTESPGYATFVAGNAQKARVEVKNNTLVGSDANVAPDRKPGIVPGISSFLTLEQLFPSIPTSSNAIEYTKENVFTNSAAEAAEAAEKGESALTWTLVNLHVSTVAHWIKISRQLASDNLALAAYVNMRMVYGVERRIETQLGAGDGISPNLSGIADTGNFTVHGYTLAALNALGTTGVLNKFKLVRKALADLWVAGFIPDAILLNPVDYATMDIEQFSSTSNVNRFQVDAGGVTRLFGVPVVQSNGIAADTFYVGNFGMAGTIHNREGVIIELSDSDDDNFTKNLVTIRAERRLCLTIERPAGIIGGDLTPA